MQDQQVARLRLVEADTVAAMTEGTINELQQAVEHQHGGKAEFGEFVPIHEELNGVVWDVNVAVFKLIDHPISVRALAWSRDTADGKHRCVVVLERLPTIVSPRGAVREAIMAGQRAK